MAQASVLFASAAGAVVLRTQQLSDLPLPRCPVNAHLGLDCPGCGTTRALTALTRGDVPAAFDHNLLAMAALPLVVVAFVWWAFPSAKPAWVGRLASSPFVPKLVFALVVAFTVIRNTAAFGGYLAST